MSYGFTKLFSSITTSTIWCESSDTRVVWVTLLAMANRRGQIWGSVPGLAKVAGVSMEACEMALKRFMEPDTYSRTKVAEGRRLEEIDGGWKLINYIKYREIRDETEMRSYKAAKQREYRKAAAGGSGEGDPKAGTSLAPKKASRRKRKTEI
jgi:hypothetical protein